MGFTKKDRFENGKLKTVPRSKKIRQGDEVVALCGNNKGQTGTVLSVDGDRVVVRGLNVRKKHVKPTEAQPKGGVVEREMSIHVSNLRVCVDGQPVKLKVRTNDEGSREFYYMRGTDAVSYRTIKK